MGTIVQEYYYLETERWCGTYSYKELEIYIAGLENNYLYLVFKRYIISNISMFVGNYWVLISLDHFILYI